MSGAGIGGLALGLAQGLRVGTDIVDSAAKRDMMAKQGKLLDLDIKDKETNNAIQEETAATWRKITGTDLPKPGGDGAAQAAPQPAASAQPAQQTQPSITEAGSPVSSGGITVPRSSDQGSGAALSNAQGVPSDAGQAPTQDAQPKGISVPGGDATQKPKFDFNNINNLAELDSQMNAIRAKYGKLDPMKAAEGMLKWTQMRNEGGIQALNEFLTTGDSEKALSTFNSLGSVKLPEGTTFRREDTSIIPGSPAKAPNVIITTPDGRTLDMRSMMRAAISPKDLMNADADLSYKAADIAVKRSAEANLKSYRDRMAGVSEETLAEHNRHNLVAEENQKTQIDSLIESRKRDDIRAENLNASRSFSNMIGYKPVDDAKMSIMSEGEKKAYFAKQDQLSMLQTIYDMNLDSKTGKANVSPAEINRFYKSGLGGETKLDEATGFNYVEFGGKKVYVPDLRAPVAADASAANKPTTTPAAATPAPTAPGIRPPPPSSQSIFTGTPGIGGNQAAIDAATKANAERASAEAARREAAAGPMREEAAQITADSIRSMSPVDAAKLRAKYLDFLTPEQNGLLLRRSRQ